MTWTHCAIPILLVGILVVAGCDSSDRISKLEKQNTELKTQLENLKTTHDYDLQEKCNRDAKEWFREDGQQRWDDPKTAIFASYNSHYNRTSNACFIMAERHVKSSFGEDGSWSNAIELWDVLENSKYASFQEDHLVFTKPYRIGDSVVECQVTGNKCESLVEFNAQTHPYMSK